MGDLLQISEVSVGLKGWRRGFRVAGVTADPRRLVSVEDLGLRVEGLKR